MRWKARIVVLALLPLTLGSAAADRPKLFEGSPEQARTMNDLRSVGTAMYVWYREEVEPRRKKVEQEQKKAAPTLHPVDSVPVISREDLAKVLVPKYIEQIPEKDGWGHPYEYRLNTQDPDAEHIMALRSPGGDGQFSGTSYEIGGFLFSEAGQDLAWMDGYFVRWPLEKAAK